jgi:hypothetical protein
VTGVGRLERAEPALSSTTTVFGTPREVTVSEPAVEALCPADEAARAIFASG